ncbi:MAG: amino acid adenylation domain-containing protein, partial [Acidobacteria bacterium]
MPQSSCPSSCLSPDSVHLMPSTSPATPSRLSALDRDRVERRLRAREAVAARIPRRAADPPPLSYAQQILWLHSQLVPDVPLYNEPITLQRKAPLDVRVLERSLEEIIRRHEAWRTTFAVRDGEPVQIVNPPWRVELPVVDLRGVPRGGREAEATRVATEDARRMFDLARGPLLRGIVVTLDDWDHRIFFTLHHIIFDGVSTYRILLPEITSLYEAFSNGRPSPLPELPIQYGDYAAWERQAIEQGRFDPQLDYWRRALAGPIPAMNLPTDRVRPHVQRYRGGIHPVNLSAALSEALRRLSRERGTTLFVTLAAAFVGLLHRYSGQDELVVGTVSAGRKHTELEDLLGFFLNPLAVRADVSGDPTFAELMRRVRRVTLDALSNDDVPFDLVLQALQSDRDFSRNPLYQVLFSLEPPMPPLPAGWHFTQVDVEVGVSKFDMYLELDDRPAGIVGRFAFNTDLFERPTMALLAERWRRLLEAVAKEPDLRLSRIPLLHGSDAPTSAADTVRPLNSFVRIERQDIEQSIAKRFEAQVTRRPGQTAVKTPAGELSYGRLNALANRVAHALLAAGAGMGDRVALLLEHDARMVAGILGVLKAGSAYVPVDPTHPPDRLSSILRDAEVGALLTCGGHLAVASRLADGRVPVLRIDDLPPGANMENPGLTTPPDGAAYLLYTSGSTGQPKGVAQNQRNVLHHIACYTNNLHIAAEDRLTLISSYSVDAAVMDIFGAVLNGAALYPIDVRETGFLGLGARLVEERISVYHSTPTVFRHMVAMLPEGVDLSGVRLVVLGGEEAVRQDAESFKRRFPASTILVNGLGPTESTVSLQQFMDGRAPLLSASVPVGFPVEDTEALLLSADGVPAQLYGEIAIRSAHLALGYWNRPELTASSFLPDPEGGNRRIYRTGDMGRLLPDGSILFAGRRDQQVKIRGYRVEAGEIEAVLLAAPGVREAVVVGAEDGRGERQLVAYLVTEAADRMQDAELRRFVSQQLPPFMVPAAFVTLDAMPLTPSGKLDRRALPEAGDRAVAEAAKKEPQTPTQSVLLDIWRSLLGIPAIGVDDDFFALGGHSLLAVRMFSEIEARLGVRRDDVLASLMQGDPAVALAPAGECGIYVNPQTLEPG